MANKQWEAAGLKTGHTYVTGSHEFCSRILNERISNGGTSEAILTHIEPIQIRLMGGQEMVLENVTPTMISGKKRSRKQPRTMVEWDEEKLQFIEQRKGVPAVDVTSEFNMVYGTTCNVGAITAKRHMLNHGIRQTAKIGGTLNA